MSVTVRFFAAARAAAGAPEIHVAAGSLGEILRALTADHPALAQVLPRCSYLLDETAVHGDLETLTVADGSTVDVLPPFAGG